MNGNIKSRLELIRDAANAVKARINDILEKNNRLEIAAMAIEPYEQDLYRLMREMADVANPVLQQMGLDKNTIVSDIEEFVKILDDNEQVLYFAAINIEAKYSKNRYALVNLLHWFGRLDKSIGKVIDFMELESEGTELGDLFKIIDDSKLTKAEKEKLKTAFKEALNKIKGMSG